MRRIGWFAGLAVIVALGVSVTADDVLLKFDGGIGVIPGPNGVANANVVRGVAPGGQPWVISRLTASVKASGRISVDGRGLLLAGGNNTGTNGNQSVEAALFCGADRFDSDVVALDPSGDFAIDGLLTPAFPGSCDNPALLIVSGGNRWFAAGILKRGGQ